MQEGSRLEGPVPRGSSLRAPTAQGGRNGYGRVRDNGAHGGALTCGESRVATRISRGAGQRTGRGGRSTLGGLIVVSLAALQAARTTRARTAAWPGERVGGGSARLDPDPTANYLGDTVYPLFRLG